jgi:hypothetical protein
VTLNLAGIDCGDWETISGREMDSDGDAYRPLPGQSQVAMGGPKTYSDITLTRTYLTERDAQLVRTLRTLGPKAVGSCTESELDDDYNAFGEKTTWSVRLKGLTAPDSDRDSANRKKLEVTLTVSGDPS